MLAAVDWANLTVAGAFMLGAGLGAVMALRVMRIVFGVRGGLGRQRRDPPDDA